MLERTSLLIKVILVPIFFFHPVSHPITTLAFERNFINHNSLSQLSKVSKIVIKSVTGRNFLAPTDAIQ
jgi:hypothetical protein